MKMARINIQLSTSIKAKLDALRAQGTTASGFIRSLLEREFKTDRHKNTHESKAPFTERRDKWVQTH